MKPIFSLRGGRILTSLSLAVALLGANQAHAAKAYNAIVTYVTDGDTLWVQALAGGPPRKLRLDGIDAPEICQPGGAAARTELQQRVLHQPVAVTVRRSDDYGRALARIELSGGDVAAQMVRSGQAWSYRWRRDHGPYAAEEAAARQAGRGLFAASAPELPRDFRQRHGPCHAVKP